MLDNLKPCRWCGSTDLKMNRGEYGFYVICRGCDTIGPTGIIIHDAIKEWNKEMSIPVTIKDTSYRGRVDRMVAALKNHYGVKYDSGYIAKMAIEQVDAIDKALAEREARDV